MLRSMFSAISGLRSHQTMMDVTGNNIANVNTTGYKSSRATFQEALTQVTRGATGPAAPTQGGTNPFQVGLGVQVAGTDSNFGQGSVQTTGRATDLSINGDGFFLVQSNGQTSYTRAGAFNWDADGNLVTPNGDFVVGTDGNPVAFDPTTHTDAQIGSDGSVSARNLSTGVLENVGTVAVASFVNPNGLVAVGNGLYQPTDNSGAPAVGAPGSGPRGYLQSGTLEMSNVDLAAEFTNMIIAQRGFQANARTITSSDEILQELVNLKR